MANPTAESVIMENAQGKTLIEVVTELVTAVNAQNAALTSAVAVLTEKAAEIATHSRVMAPEANAGHFKPGMGFEYDETTRTHNVNGTVDFSAALVAAVTPLQITLSNLTWRGLVQADTGDQPPAEGV